MTPRSRGARAARALAAAALGTVAALVALELGLRAAAWIAASSGGTSRPLPAPDGRPVIVFVGDSNVYGLHVGKQETLAAQTEALARELCPPGFLAVNRGRPGSPSWVALAEAKAAIEHDHPTAVFVQVGLNNRILVRPESASWYDRFRIARLVRIGTRNLSVRAASAPSTAASAPRADGEIDEENMGPRGLRIRTQPRDGAPAGEFEVEHTPRIVDHATEVRPGLLEDLRAIASAARAAGAQTFFASYLADFYEFDDACSTLAQAASETKSTFVDFAVLGRRAFAEREHEDVLFSDFHATPLGYTLEARELLRALAAQGVVTCAPIEDPIEWLKSQPAPPRAIVGLEVVGRDPLALAVRFAPGSSGRVLLGVPGKSRLQIRFEIPIAEDDFAMRVRQVDALAFEIGASGEARVVVPPDLASSLPRDAVAVAVIAIDPDKHTARLVKSNLVELAPRGR